MLQVDPLAWKSHAVFIGIESLSDVMAADEAVQKTALTFHLSLCSFIKGLIFRIGCAECLNTLENQLCAIQKSRNSGPSLPKLGKVGALLPHLAALLCHLGAILDRSVGPSCSQLRARLRILDKSLADRGTVSPLGAPQHGPEMMNPSKNFGDNVLVRSQIN